MRCARRKRHTCCSCTSPSSAAISSPVHRANPAGGGFSSTARMRWPVSPPYLGAGPGRGDRPNHQALPGEPPTPCAHRPRHRADGSRNRPRRASSAASNMIAREARRAVRGRCRSRASSTARSSGKSRTPQLGYTRQRAKGLAHWKAQGVEFRQGRPRASRCCPTYALLKDEAAACRAGPATSQG